MITNKDIRVENGNLIINGDKYPLDGQSPEAIMQIVEDNSDTTPTENSDAPVTSGGVYTALGTKQDTLTFDTTPTASSDNPVQSGGIKTYVDTAAAKLSGNFSTTQYTDLDDLPHGSIVQVLGSAAHAPGNPNHYYIVFTYFIGGTTTYKLQFAIENTVGDLYTRDCQNGTWGNWNKFAKTT